VIVMRPRVKRQPFQHQMVMAPRRSSSPWQRDNFDFSGCGDAIYQAN
jgi:hypothetical protein